MKRLFIIGAFALGLAGSLEAKVGSNGPNILIVGPTDKQFGILVEDEKASGFMVKIIDNMGYILHKEENLDSYYAKRFDLEQLAYGNYKLEIEDNEQIRSIPIKITRAGVVIDSKNMLTMVKPEIRNDHSIIRLNMPAYSLPVNVSIFDAVGNTIHQANYDDKETINARFDLSNLEKGEYTIKVKFNSRIFGETVKIIN